MKLYCVRHGEACRSDQDPCCQLTSQGQKDVTRVARHLANSGVSIHQILHSSKLRAKQTAAILTETLQIASVTECPSLLDSEARVEDLLAMLPSWTEDTMIVSHLPFLPQLVNALILNDSNHSPIIHFPPATVICLERQDAQRWIVRWVLNPEIVPS